MAINLLPKKFTDSRENLQKLCKFSLTHTGFYLQKSTGYLFYLAPLRGGQLLDLYQWDTDIREEFNNILDTMVTSEVE
jgi:hypothetical protein